MADGDQPTSNGPAAALDLEDLKKQAEIAELQAKIKQAQLDQTKAQLETEMALAKARVEQELTVATKRGELLQTLLPEAETKPLAGKIEADEKAGYTAELIAYRVMQKLEDDLVGSLAEQGGLLTDAKILIVDKLDHAPGDVSLVEVDMQFKLFGKTIRDRKNDNNNFKQRYDEIRPQQTVDPATAALVVAAVPSVIGAFADVAGYFSTDRSIKGREFELKTEGLVAALAGRLRAKGATVYLPNFHVLSQSTLLDSFAQLQQQALELKTSKELLSSQVIKPLSEHIQSANLQIKNLESELQKLDSTTQQEKITQIKQQLQDLREVLRSEQQLIDEANAAVQASDTILTAFDNFTKAIMTTPADGQPPKLVQAVLRQRIHKLEVKYILWLGTLSSGGDAATEDRQFRSDSMSFTGGTAIAFVLANQEGEVIAADTLTGIAALNHRMTKGENNRIQHISF